MFRGRNYVFFKTDKLAEDSIIIGGNALYFDPTYDPQRNARIYGTVYSIPYKLSKIIIGQFPQGKPKYQDPTPAFRYLDEIAQEIKVNDKIYFHYNTLGNPEHSFMANDINGDPVYSVRYDLIYCAVRNGLIIPIGGNVLIEPLKEAIDDILHPLKDLDGNILSKDKWIQLKPEPGYIFLQGIVRVVGTPLKNDGPQILKPGDHVIIQSNYDRTIKIEGSEYYAVKNKHILGVIHEKARTTVAA